MRASEMPGMFSTDTDKDSMIAAALAKIRTDFVDGLIPLLNEVEYQSRALGDPATASSAMKSLRHVVHKVSGIAGSVGYAELGDHAAKLDIRLTKMLSDAPDLNAIATIEPPLEVLMDLMEQILDDAL